MAEVQRYTETAMREGLADSAHDKSLSRPNREQTVVSLSAKFAKNSPDDLKTKGKSYAVVGLDGLEYVKEIKGLVCPAALLAHQRNQRLTRLVSHAHQSIPFIISIASAASRVRFTPLV